MTVEPVTQHRAKRHLRLESDDPGADVLGEYITAARQTVEQYLNASIIEQTRTMKLDAFPAAAFMLPNGPVKSITSVVYLDADGVSQTLAASKYRLVTYPLVDLLEPAYGEAWPTTRDVSGAITVTYVAGMMTDDVLASQDVIAGILLTLADLWEVREAGIIGVSHTVNPTVANLLHFHRRHLGV